MNDIEKLCFFYRFIPGTIKLQTDFIKCVDRDNHPKGNHRVCQNVRAKYNSYYTKVMHRYM